MPHLVTHMALAKELADAFRHPLLDVDRGSFYMGSAGPDMHILDGRMRHASHFFYLDTFHEQDSVSTFFAAHPGLKRPRDLKADTAAFVAGYLTHLVMDEQWITEIYRPFFGPTSPLHGDTRANILDRVIQYDMDLQRRQQSALMLEIQRALLASPLDVELEFIDRGNLERWRDVAVEMLVRPPDWNRFRYLAGRFLKSAGVDTEEQLNEFLKTVPDLLREAKGHVGEERLSAYAARVRDCSREVLGSYLK